MKAGTRILWIAVPTLVALFVVYPLVDQAMFGLQFSRRVRAGLSKETHEGFTNRMSAITAGMTTNQVLQILGKPTTITVSDAEETLSYEWRGATTIDRVAVMASGREHQFKFVCRKGVVERVDQSEAGWCQGAVR